MGRHPDGLGGPVEPDRQRPLRRDEALGPIGFAEHLAIVHRDDDIRVSVLCPQVVDTAMARRNTGGPHPARLDGVMSADEVAASAIAGLKADKFLILLHAAVGDYMANKARDYDRWLAGMAKLLRILRGSAR